MVVFSLYRVGRVVLCVSGCAGVWLHCSSVLSAWDLQTLQIALVTLGTSNGWVGQVTTALPCPLLQTSRHVLNFYSVFAL